MTEVTNQKRDGRGRPRVGIGRTRTLFVSVPTEFHDELDAFCSQHDFNRSELVRWALRKTYGIGVKKDVTREPAST